jgi:hypothetical protein
MVWYSEVWFGLVYGMWYGMVWYGMVWYGMVWYGMVWYGMVWYGVASTGGIVYGMVYILFQTAPSYVEYSIYKSPCMYYYYRTRNPKSR